MNSKYTIVNIVASVLGYVINAAVNFFLSPYIVSTIGEAAYGFVALANTFTTYAALISTAINSVSSRFILVSVVDNDIDKANIYINSVYIANMALGILFAIVGAIVIVRIDTILQVPMSILEEVRILFAFVFSSFILLTMGSVFDTCYFVLNKLFLSSLRTVMTVFLNAIIVFVLFSTRKPHIYYIGIGAFFSAVVTVIVNRLMMQHLLPFARLSYRKSKLKPIIEIASAGIWNSINSLGTVLTEGLDLMLCNIFLGPELMGVMSLSKLIPTILKSIGATISSTFGPDIVTKYAAKERMDLKRYLMDTVKIMRVITCVPYGVFCGLGLMFYRLWLPDIEPYLLYALSTLSLLATFFVTSTSSVYSLFMAANRLRVPSIAHVVGGGFSVLLVLLLLKTTTLGIYAVAGVSSVIGLIKSFLVI